MVCVCRHFVSKYLRLLFQDNCRGFRAMSFSAEAQNIFHRATRERSAIYRKETAIVSQLESIFDARTGRVTIADKEHPVEAEPSAVYPVTLTPHKSVFRALFYAFAGPVAALPLPPGCFFGGSAVLAAMTLPQGYNDQQFINAASLLCHHIYEVKKVCTLALYRGLTRVASTCPKFTIIREIMAFAAFTHEDVVLQLDSFKPTGADDDEDVKRDYHYADPCWWDDNGCGPYNRSDVDIFVCAETIDEANTKVKVIYESITRDVDCVVVKTPHTITFACSWPLRHIQVVLLIGTTPSTHLLFADLDCTAICFDGHDVLTTERCRFALAHKVNIVPPRMLQIRKDEPKRVAKYVKRGFSVFYLPDSSFSITEFEDLKASISTELEYKGKPYLNLSLDDTWMNAKTGALDTANVLNILSRTNTVYSEVNIPRMRYLTSECIGAFFRHLGTLVDSVHQIPCCRFKLVDKPLEQWVKWYMM